LSPEPQNDGEIAEEVIKCILI